MFKLDFQGAALHLHNLAVDWRLTNIMFKYLKSGKLSSADGFVCRRKNTFRTCSHLGLVLLSIESFQVRYSHMRAFSGVCE